MTCFITSKKLEIAHVSLNKRMDFFFFKLWHIPTVECHSAIKKEWAIDTQR